MTGTLALLGHRPAFARLWIAEVVSLGGDWFTLVALSVAVVRTSDGSGLALGALIVTQLLPMVLLGPWSGVLVDRADRRRLLVASDLARFVIVLLFVPAAESGRLAPLYAVNERIRTRPLLGVDAGRAAADDRWSAEPAAGVPRQGGHECPPGDSD